MMHMTFYWGKTVTLLFDEWFVQSWLGYSLSLVALFLVGVFHEWFSSKRTSFSSAVESRAAGYHERHGEEHGHHVPLIGKVRGPSSSQAQKLAEALLHTVTVGIGYLLMLAVMSFNGGVFIAIALGLGFGFYLFRAGTSLGDSSDACAAT